MDIDLCEKENLPVEKPRYERIMQTTSEDHSAASENQFHIQIENSTDAIVLIDSNGIVKYQSPAYAKMMGRSDYQRIGRKCIEFVHPDDYGTFKNAFDRILNYPGLPVKFVLRNQHKNGLWLNLDCVANNLLGESGIQSIVVNISDSTDRWYAQEALRESEGLYADLVLNQIAGVYRILIKKPIPGQAISDSVTHEFVSDRFCDIIGIEKTVAVKMPGSRIFEVIHPDDKQDFVNANEEANINMHPFSWEGRILADTTKWVRFESNPRKLDDGSIRWTGVVIDITKQKLVEELLKASEAKLKDLNATKDRFFSIIAHDLKGPFNGIIGLSEILCEDAGNLNTSTISEYAGMINASALQTHRLLDNLLKWARMQEGKMSFNPVRNVLHKVVGEVILLFADLAERKKIVLVNQVPTQMTVDADTEMLKTIFRNLISNAVKFTNANGIVSIEATNKDATVEIVVADNGNGIRAEDICKLFKVDIAFSTRGTENERGTGLGLVLCKEFVEKHGGIITVESKPGKGSRFKLTLPFKTVESD